MKSPFSQGRAQLGTDRRRLRRIQGMRIWEEGVCISYKLTIIKGGVSRGEGEDIGRRQSTS